MKDLCELFFKIYSFYSFSSYFEGLAFFGRIITVVYTKILTITSISDCSEVCCPKQTHFHHLEHVKVDFFLGGGFHKHPGWCLPLFNPCAVLMWTLPFTILATQK